MKEIVKQLAEGVCQRVTSSVISGLQQQRSCCLSGEDSGLQNAWDEICVQLQQGYYIFWDSYDLTVRAFVEQEVRKLRTFEQQAVWLQTP